MNLIVKFFSFFITLPFLAFVAVYYFVTWYYKDRKKAIDIAINVTTFCLFLSVSVMFQVIGQFRSGVIISIFILFVLLITIIALQWNIKQQIDINKALRSSFRLWFIALCICYLILFFIGILREFI